MILAAALTLTGCDKEQIPQAENNEYHIGETFNVAFNECVTLVDSIGNETYRLCFDSVWDGRCVDSACYLCYGSTADIVITWIDQDSTELPLTLLGCRNNTEPLCNDQYYYRKDTLGLRFCLLKLAPYPDGTLLDQNDYVAKLIVEEL